MAKVGNEAKLILRLAEEQALTEELRITRVQMDDEMSEVQNSWYNGRKTGLDWYRCQLKNIIRDIERN